MPADLRDTEPAPVGEPELCPQRERRNCAIPSWSSVFCGVWCHRELPSSTTQAERSFAASATSTDLNRVRWQPTAAIGSVRRHTSEPDIINR